MTITQLQYVLAVAEYRNFTVAAEKCFVTQPTLSMQVQKLEDELDLLIFDRSKKPISITEAGQKIVDQAKNIVQEAARIRDIVDQEKGFIGGTYTLGVIPTVMPTLLPMFLKPFTARYPNVRLIIKEQGTESLIANLQDTERGVAAPALQPQYRQPGGAAPVLRAFCGLCPRRPPPGGPGENPPGRPGPGGYFVAPGRALLPGRGDQPL